MLLLNVIGKYYGGPLVQLHLSFVNLKGHCQGYSDFKGLYLVKEPS